MDTTGSYTGYPPNGTWWILYEQGRPNYMFCSFHGYLYFTGHKVMGTIVDKSDFTDNYRAEGLGAIGGILIL